jgi:EpsI family protein
MPFKKMMPAKILTALLILQATLFYGLSRGEPAVLAQPLSRFPEQFGPWRIIRDNPMDNDVMETLRADDYLNRDYIDSAGRRINLFVAFFKSQRAGQTPHSPKNCLPGAGWVWSVSDTIPLALEGRATPAEINRYIVSKGDDKAAVLYWYQSHGRIVASEYRAAAFAAWDALRYNRTDTALVRVVIPIEDNHDAVATSAGLSFIEAIFPTLQVLLSTGPKPGSK